MARSKPRPIYTLDCETDPFKQGRVPQPFVWGLYGESTFRIFATAREVAEFLVDKEWLVYAHNGGRFDYHYLRDFINVDEPLMVIGGRIARFKIGECEFRDSMNLFNESLAKFEKSKVDYALFEPELRDIPVNRQVILEYLRSDCINLYNLVQGFVERFGLHLTQAGAAMRYWKKNFNAEIPRQSRFQFAALKPFYYGGRVQCFASGHRSETFNVVDINSAYPAMMRMKHPYSAGSHMKLGLVKGEALGPCMVKVRAVSKGALPIRTNDGSLFFPDDEKTVRTYFVTGWEIMAGLETGTLKIDKVLECHVFDQLISFADYVQHFYEARNKAEKGSLDDLFSKRMMNALYGRFAMNPANYSEYVLASREKRDDWISKGFLPDEEWRHAILMARPVPDEKQRFINIGTAASITGAVRGFLWRSLQACSGLIYCDTDSIAARDVSALDLDTGATKELGRWKLEARCDEYAIAGKKTYAFHVAGTDRAWVSHEAKNWKVASKGAKLTAPEIIRISNGEVLDYSPDVPTYSIHSLEPTFVPREIKTTYKDIARLAA